MEKLEGGNTNSVYKDEDTVIRNTTSNSAFVHSLLQWLESKGYEESPRLLDSDNGKERLTYIQGEVGNYPLKNFFQTDATLVSAAKLLRKLHDITTTFEISGTARSGEVVCHNDFAPYNIVYRDDRIVGIIDFDQASFGTRIWDVAYSVYRFAPLGTDAHCLQGWGTIPDRKTRFKLFCDVYGINDYQAVLDTVLRRIHTLMTYMIDTDQKLEHLSLYEKDILYIKDNYKYLSS